jgi:DNA-binding CsgD family transcriptional regulator
LKPVHAGEGRELREDSRVGAPVTALELASRAPEALPLSVEKPQPESDASRHAWPARTSAASEGAALWVLAWPAALFVMITAFIAFDLAADIEHGVANIHLYIEIVAFVLAISGVAGTTVQLRRALSRARVLQQDLVGTRVELERSRSEAEALLRRLGSAIDHHFDRWELTSAERGIALLVLKGLSYKEVATARGTTERTVRHQALAIYRKAGVAGRAELAAFFLQDLLVQSQATSPAESDEAP